MCGTVLMVVIYKVMPLSEVVALANFGSLFVKGGQYAGHWFGIRWPDGASVFDWVCDLVDRQLIGFWV